VTWAPAQGGGGSGAKSKDGALQVSLSSPGAIGAFGELLTVELRPRVALDGIYGLNASQTETFAATGGSVSGDSTTGLLTCATGTSANGYGVIRTHQPLRYHPGQGITIRGTALFTSPVALSLQAFGGFTSVSRAWFGYNGTSFGVHLAGGGVLHYSILTITAAATGGETATVTLNGTPVNVSLTSGTIAHTAYELGIDDYSGAVHDAWQNGDEVHFLHTGTPGALAGAFTFSSTGTADGTFATTTTGVARTETWVEQDDWNPGLPADFLPALDPTKGNVYEIDIQYLGFGRIEYRIEHPVTGQFVTVHRWNYANRNTIPNLVPPILKPGWIAASLGSTTDLTVSGASLLGAIQGEHRVYDYSRGANNTKSGIGTTFTSVLQVRARKTFAGVVSNRVLIPRLLTVAVDGTKPAEIAVYVTPTLAGEPNWSYEDEDNSIAEIDTAATTLSNGATLVIAAGVGKAGTDKIDLSGFNLHIDRGETLTVCVRSTSGNTDATVGITWDED
jgi:hypothetical protein